MLKFCKRLNEMNSEIDDLISQNKNRCELVTLYAAYVQFVRYIEYITIENYKKKRMVMNCYERSIFFEKLFKLPPNRLNK